MKKPKHWKLIADLNISIKTVGFLQSLGLDILRIDKSISTDEELVSLAKKENRVILTYDKDFGEIFYFHKEKIITVIVISVEDQTSESVNKILNNFFVTTEFEYIKNKLVILYEYRYRLIS